MASKKKIRVRDVINLMDAGEMVICNIYAYGILYGNTWRDHMETAGDCLERMNSVCLDAVVFNIKRGWANYGEAQTADQWIEIEAEIIGS